MTTQWIENAKYVEKIYGTYVNWEDEFYICPFCEEPVYNCDWSDEELNHFLCPVCEDIDRED